MKLHFPWSGIEKLLAELIPADAVQPLYGEVTGKGLWLVGDQGVYLMSNAARAGDSKPVVVYADECDPQKLPFDEWWENKRASFGGDDGVEFLAPEAFIRMRREDPTHLVIEMGPEQLVLTTTRRIPR
jgi:hypothetical protein